MNSSSKEIKVYIIESQSDMELLAGRNEGRGLSSILDLIGIRNQYYQVINTDTLREAFSRISQDIIANKLTTQIHPLPGEIIVPYCHFSCHGNKEGIGLTNKEFLNWVQLAGLIKSGITDKIGYLTSGGLKVSPLYLSFSSCEGYHASAMSDIFDEGIYTGLVGPTEYVDWSDSLLAFSIFYHNMYYKEMPMGILDRINGIIGKEKVFKMSLSKNGAIIGGIINE